MEQNGEYLKKNKKKQQNNSNKLWKTVENGRNGEKRQRMLKNWGKKQRTTVTNGEKLWKKQWTTFKNSEKPWKPVKGGREAGREGGLTNKRPGNWSCDLRANEMPQKTSSNGANKLTDTQTQTQTDITTIWLNRPCVADSVIWFIINGTRIPLLYYDWLCD